MHGGNRGLAATPTETPKCDVPRSFSSFETFSSCDREKTDRRTDQESARRDKMGTRPIRVVAGRRSTSNDRPRPSVNFDSKRARVTCHRQSPRVRLVRVSSPRSPINSIVTIAYANIPNFSTKFNLYRSSDALKYWVGN